MVFGARDSQDVGNRAASEEGTVVSGNGSLSLDGFSVPGRSPAVARGLGPSGRGTHSLTDCGVCMGYTGCEERPTGSRPP